MNSGVPFGRVPRPLIEEKSVLFLVRASQDGPNASAGSPGMPWPSRPMHGTYIATKWSGAPGRKESARIDPIEGAPGGGNISWMSW